MNGGRRIIFLSCALGIVFARSTWIIPLAHADGATPSVVSVVTATTANGQTDGYPGGTIALAAGGIRTIYVNGVVEDADGKADIDAVSAAFHRSGAPNGDNCTADAANCYVVSSCALGDNENANQKTYSCRVDLQHIAQSTVSGGQYPSENWVAYVYVTDGTLFATSNTTTKEIDTLLALTIPASIPFGNRNLNEQSTAANNAEMILTQRGNVEADVEVSMAGPLVCASGSIPRANVKWALTDVGYTHASTTALTGSPVDTNVFVPFGTQGQPSPTQTLYWNLAIPVEGVGGYCTNTVTISAIAH